MHVTESFDGAIHGEVAGFISGLGPGFKALWYRLYAAHTLTLKSYQRTMSG